MARMLLRPRQADCLSLELNGYSVFALLLCVFEWHGRRMSKYHQRVRQAAFDKVPKNRDGILRAHDGIIEWTSFLRFAQGLVHNFFDTDDEGDNKPKESAAEKLQRDQGCSMSECSDPDFWQEVHRAYDEDEDDSGASMADENWLADYVTAKNSALGRARRGFQRAEVRRDYEMMRHYENIIDTSRHCEMGDSFSVGWQFLLTMMV